VSAVSADDFQRNRGVEHDVRGAIHIRHPAKTHDGIDSVRTKRGANPERGSAHRRLLPRARPS
jgi:hypothetical protein